MNNGRRYEHLQAEERVLIAAHASAGVSIRESAGRLGRAAGAISRELARNTIPGQGYSWKTAQCLTEQRRIDARPLAKLDPSGPLWPLVVAGLEERWSPEQIARTLRQQHPLEPEHRVSHETIYTTIYAHAKGELRKELIACLRQGRSTRK